MSINKSLFVTKIKNFLAAKIANKNPLTDKLIYSYEDPYYNGVGQFIRNPSCWINGVENMSCFSPAQLSGASWNTRAGTLLTKKHVLFAKHFLPAIIAGGTPLIFVDDQNNVIRRNIVQISSHPFTDISIGLLDSDVPSNIKIAKVLPKNYTNYFDLTFQNQIYAVGIDQQEKALPKVNTGLQNWITNGGTSQNILFDNPSVNPWPTFAETIISGDSGNPVFFIIDNQLVVLTTWWTPTSGPFLTTHYDDINNMIESLSPGQGYNITDIDLEVAYLNMQKIYFSPTIDNLETTLGNWYLDSNLTIQSQFLPLETDQIIGLYVNRFKTIIKNGSPYVRYKNAYAALA